MRCGVDVAIGALAEGTDAAAGRRPSSPSTSARWRSPRATPAPRFYWDWARRRSELSYRKFCGTPPHRTCAGLEAALALIDAEGLDAKCMRAMRRLARAVHAAVERLGPKAARCGSSRAWPEARSVSVTAIEVARRHRSRSAAQRRARALPGRDRRRPRARCTAASFRIGHLGDMNEAMLLGCLAGVQAAMQCRGHRLRPAAASTPRSPRCSGLIASGVEALTAAGTVRSLVRCRACAYGAANALVMCRSADRVQGEVTVISERPP